jgi:hypothetical protein
MNRGTLGRQITRAAPLVAVLLVPTQVWALDQLSGGVSLGGFQAGTVPRLAVSPHAGVSWGIGSGFIVTIHDLCNFLPPINDAGIGLFNETSISIGYTSEKAISALAPRSRFTISQRVAQRCVVVFSGSGRVGLRIQRFISTGR